MRLLSSQTAPFALVLFLVTCTYGASEPTSLRVSSKKFEKEVSIDKISPDHGPTCGGTWLKVQGSGFNVHSEGAACRFTVSGDIVRVVPAWIEKESLLWCRSPSIPVERSVELSVSMDGKSYSTPISFDVIQYISGSPEFLPMMRLPGEDSTTKGRVLVEISPYFAQSNHKKQKLYEVELWDVGSHEKLGSVKATPGRKAAIEFDLSALPKPPVKVLYDLVLVDSPDEGSFLELQENATGESSSYKDGVHTFTGSYYFTPYNEKTVSIDFARKKLMYGQDAFLPVGVMMNGEMSIERVLEQVTLLSRFGINYIFIQDVGEWNLMFGIPHKLLSLLEHMSSTGLLLQVDVSTIVNRICETKDSYIAMLEMEKLEKIVNATCGHPSVMGYFIKSGLSSVNHRKLGMVYSRIKQLDPYHPLFGNILGDGEDLWTYFGTTQGLDIPQLIYHDPKTPESQIDILKSEYPANFAPLFVAGIVVDWGFGTPAPYTSLANALTVMYGGAGVNMFFYWVSDSGTIPDLAMYAIVESSKLHELAPAFTLSELDNPDDLYPDISFKTMPDTDDRKVIGRVYREKDCNMLTIVIANVRGQPCGVKATVPLLKKHIEETKKRMKLYTVYGERELEVDENGSFYDGIDEFAVRFYRVNLEQSHTSGDDPHKLERGLSDSAYLSGLRNQLIPVPKEKFHLSKDLVLNGDFESFTRALRPQHYGSASVGLGTFGLSSLVGQVPPINLLDPSISDHGRHSLKIINPDPSSSAGTYQVIMTGLRAFESGKEYKLSFSARRGFSGMLDQSVIITPLVEGFWFDPLNKHNLEYQCVWTGDDMTLSEPLQWKRIETTISFSSSVESEFHVMIFQIRGHAPVWVDNVQIVAA